MKPRNFYARARRMLDALDLRLEGQTLRKGADAPHCVSLVSVFNRAAGDLERVLSHELLPANGAIVSALRVLHRVVVTHDVLVRHRGLRLVR